MVNPPWIDNYDDWKYRRVKLKGRYIHAKSMYIPNEVNNY